MLKRHRSDGEHLYRNNNEGMTMKAMNEAAETDPFIAGRVQVFRYRTQEELYDLKNDPDCLKNLIDQPEYADQADRLRGELLDWMKRTADPLEPAFESRQSPERVKEVLEQVYGKPVKRAKKNPKRGRKAANGA